VHADSEDAQYSLIFKQWIICTRINVF